MSSTQRRPFDRAASCGPFKYLGRKRLLEYRFVVRERDRRMHKPALPRIDASWDVRRICDARVLRALYLFFSISALLWLRFLLQPRRNKSCGMVASFA